LQQRSIKIILGNLDENHRKEIINGEAIYFIKRPYNNIQIAFCSKYGQCTAIAVNHPDIISIVSKTKQWEEEGIQNDEHLIILNEYIKSLGAGFNLDEAIACKHKINFRRELFLQKGLLTSTLGASLHIERLNLVIFVGIFFN
jgi:hypothetical protein